MSFRVSIQPEAEANADHIFVYLEERSPQGAIAWYEAFERALLSLATNPTVHPLALEAEAIGRDVRQLLFKTPRGRRYRLLFELRNQTVNVLGVRGPGQPPATELPNG